MQSNMWGAQGPGLTGEGGQAGEGRGRARVHWESTRSSPPFPQVREDDTHPDKETTLCIPCRMQCDACSKYR
jgi:hypothetical protein